uniref:GYD domain-containing protein n=1 Tax=Actinomadura sp. CA-154981 TaxID=3240037 RepID=UPI003F493A05
MALAIALIKWTDQGRRTFWDTVNRAAEARRFEDDLAVTFKDIIWTPSGPYDVVFILEGPDNEHIAAFMLLQQSLGNLNAIWMPGYRAEDMASVINIAQ